MKQIIAPILAAILLLTTGYFATTVVSEQVSQSCASGDEINLYKNTWTDVYLVTEWWPKRDEGQSFIDCVGPTEYLRYHPYDLAALSFIGAGVASFIAYRFNNPQKVGKK